MPPIVGRGQIAIWEGGSLWLFRAGGELSETSVHSHHAIQIAFQLEGEFEFVAGAERSRGPITAVRSDAPHLFRASGGVAHLFIEPESPAGRALASDFPGAAALASIDTPPARNALKSLHECFVRGANSTELRELGPAIIAAMAASANVAPTDRRVMKMIEYAARNLNEPPSLKSAAAAIFLSPSRARHLFVAQTGLPFKAHVLWQRLERAVGLYAAGESLTVAAHEAGFADSAHLSRTFRRTFGLPAAALRIQDS